VFIKFPLMLLAPASCLLWSQIVTDPRPSLQRSLLCAAALAFAVGAPLLLAHPAVVMGEVEKVSGDRLAPNLRSAFEDACKGLGGVALALVAVLVARGIEARLRGRSIPEARREACDVRAPLTAPVGRAHPAVFAIVFGAAWLAPFLANGRYFAHYYLTLPLAPCAALAGRWLSAMLPARGALAASIVALALVFPRAELYPDEHEAQRARIAAFLGALRDALRDRPEPARLILVADCEGRGDEEQIAARDLHAFVERMSGLSGIRWITGFHDVDVALTLEPAPPERTVLAVRHCQGRPLRVEPR
jgi:hypothetical protein